MKCAWCDNDATTQVVVEPTRFGNIKTNKREAMTERVLVRVERKAPACRTCANRLKNQPETQRQSRKGQITGQMTLEDALSASQTPPAALPVSRPTECPGCASDRISVLPSGDVICFNCNQRTIYVSKPTIHRTYDLQKRQTEAAHDARKRYRQAMERPAGRRRNKLLVQCAEYAVEYGYLTLVLRACVGLPDDGHLGNVARDKMHERAKSLFAAGRLDYVFNGGSDDAISAELAFNTERAHG